MSWIHHTSGIRKRETRPQPAAGVIFSLQLPILQKSCFMFFQQIILKHGMFSLLKCDNQSHIFLYGNPRAFEWCFGRRGIHPKRLAKTSQNHHQVVLWHIKKTIPLIDGSIKFQSQKNNLAWYSISKQNWDAKSISQYGDGQFHENRNV